ncbi:hypothetical protein [Magnetospira sp. QH-2]|uniref:hypothetical protein n=1 Tax=Magnetospira sp. (strain QH-2) TaxID=1288970 RepID=UPI0003E81506
MAEQQNNQNTADAPQQTSGGPNAVDASEDLYLEGKGFESLEDGEQQDLSDSAPDGDVMDSASIQSAPRETFEQIVGNLVQEGEALQQTAEVVADTAEPQAVDGEVSPYYIGEPLERTPSEDEPSTRQETQPTPDQATAAPNSADDLPPEEPLLDDEEEDQGEAATAATEETAATPPDEDPEPETDPVAQTPTLTIEIQDGWEDLALKLDLDATLNDSDGAETLTIAFNDVPDGFGFSDAAGTPYPSTSPGSWSFTADQLEDLYLTRPEHYAGDVSWSIEAAATEINGDVAAITEDVTVTVEAIADAPNLAAEDVAGMENTWIDLDISTSLVDTDGSETLGAVYIADLPAGALLNHGTLTTEAVTDGDVTIPAGTWKVAVADLDDLQVQPPSNDSTDFNLRVWSTTEDETYPGQAGSYTDSAISGPETFLVDVSVLAPTVGGTGSGDEDTWADVDLTASVTAASGDETLTVTVEDMPAGTEIRLADTGQVLTADAQGRYDVTGNLDNLQVHWTTGNLDTDITFNVRALVTDDDGNPLESTAGDSATPTSDTDWNQAVTSVTVTIDAVADAPDLAAEDVAGMENTWIDLDVSASLTDTDGSESLGSVYLTGIPDDASLNHGSELTSSVTLPNGTTLPVGTWVVDPSDLADLQILPPTDDSTDFTVQVYGTSTESDGGDSAVTGPVDFLVDVSLLAPTVSGSGTGNEDTWITVDLDASISAASGDETLTVTVEDLPNGAEIRFADTGQVLTPDAQGVYDVTGNLDNLQVRWTTAHMDDDIDFNVRALVTDDDGNPLESAAGDSSTPTSGTDWNQGLSAVSVTVKAVADAPTLSASAVGVEDKWFDLNLDSQLVDQDGSESLSVSVFDLPTGVTLGLDDGNGGVTPLTPDASGQYDVTGLTDSLKLLAPTDSNTDFTLKVSATSTESATGDQLAVQTATTTKTVAVQVFGDADTPFVNVDEVPKTIDEDTFYNLRDTLQVDAGHDDANAVNGGTGEAGYLDGAMTSTDGSESLMFRITPKDYDNDGQRLAISDDDAISGDEIITPQTDGSGQVYWEVSAADVFAGKVYVGGASNWSSPTGQDSIQFDIVTVATEDDANVDDSALDGTGLTRQGSATSSTETLTLVIDPVADKTIVTASDTGREDTAIPVSPSFVLADTDGSETLIGDVVIQTNDTDLWLTGKLIYDGNPLTPTYNTGTGMFEYRIPASDLTDTSGDGTAFRLDGLTFEPAEHSGNDVTYQVQVTTRDVDDNITHTTTADGSIHVRGVADAPTLLIDPDGDGVSNSQVTGTEDTYIDLGLDAQLVDTDGSESLVNAQLRNVPDDWTVGYLNDQGQFTQAGGGNNGRWNLNLSKLDQVVVRPPVDSDADAVDIQFRVVAREGSDYAVRNAASTTTFTVIVDADADTPSMIVKNARGDEDTRIELDIRPTLADTDGSESLSIFLGDVPDGAAFYDGSGNAVGTRVSFDGDGQPVANAGGAVWMFSAVEVADLFIQPPQDSNVDLSLSVTTRSTESSNLDYAETTGTLEVVVRGVSDGPLIPDQMIDAQGRLIATGDEDNLINPQFEQYGTQDIDTSETLSIVIKDIPNGVDISMTAGNESFMKYIGGGKWSIDPDHLGDVRIAAPNDFSGEFDIGIDLITTEDDGHTASDSRLLHVTVEAEADTPSVTLSASSTEDLWGTGVTVSISPSVNDTVAGTESAETITGLSVTLNDDAIGLPNEADVQFTFRGLSMGDSLDLSGQDLTDYLADKSLLKVTGLPEDWSGDIPISTTATATDADGSTASKTATTVVKLQPDADAPTYSLTGAVDGTVGGSLDLGLSLTLNDADNSESVYLIVDGVPNGVELNQGFNNGDGTWTVLYDPSNPTALTATSSYAGEATLTVHPYVIDQDTDGDRDTHFDTTGLSVDIRFDPSGGGTGSGPITPTGGVVVDPPQVTVTPVSGTEDNTVVLDIAAVANGAGDSLVGIVISDLPAGSTLSGGYYNPLSDSWTIDPADLGSVTITPPADFAGELTLDIKAVASEDGVYETTSLDDVVVAELAPDADGPSISAATGSGATLVEDNDIPLDIALGLRDTDGSESLGSVVTIDGLPSGAVLIDGAGTPLTANVDGSYTIDVANLSDIGFRPPADFHGSVTLNVTATSLDSVTVGGSGVTDTGSTTQSFSFSIAADADTPTVGANDVSGSEDNSITLDLSASSQDAIGGLGDYNSEYLSVVIGNVPDGAVLSGAFNNNDGTWTIKGSNINVETGEITGVSLLPPENFSGNIDLSLTAYSLEPSNTDIASSSTNFMVQVAGVADTPEIDPAAATGVEDTQIAVSLNASLMDDSEYLSIIIEDVPDGASFTDGNGNAVGIFGGLGLWSIPLAQAATLHFVPPAHASGDYTLSAYAVSLDGSDAQMTQSMPFTITVTGEADTPTLSVQDAAGAEDSAIAVDLSAALVDTDGSETLQVIIEGAPDDSVFDTATGTVAQSGDGKWYLDSDQLNNLQIRTPDDYNGQVTLTVTAQSTEGGTTAATTQTLTLDVTAVNDDPTAHVTASAQSVVGAIDSPIFVLPDADMAGQQISFADVDDSAITRMDISIDNGALMGDSLGLKGIDLGTGTTGNLVVDGTDITVSYNADLQTLSFEGEADFSTYADLAEKVVFTNLSTAIEPGDRDFSITIYDDEGGSGSVGTHATIGDLSGTIGVQLNEGARPDVLWSEDGAAATGTSDGDQFVYHYGDGSWSVSGGSGVDELFIMNQDGLGGDWSINQVDANTYAIAGQDHASWMIHIDQGSVDTNASSATELAFDGDASGTIELENGAVVQFEDLDKIIV